MASILYEVMACRTRQGVQLSSGTYYFGYLAEYKENNSIQSELSVV